MGSCFCSYYVAIINVCIVPVLSLNKSCDRSHTKNNKMKHMCRVFPYALVSVMNGARRPQIT
jgi:hypothetical protein